MLSCHLEKEASGAQDKGQCLGGRVGSHLQAQGTEKPGRIRSPRERLQREGPENWPWGSAMWTGGWPRQGLGGNRRYGVPGTYVSRMQATSSAPHKLNLAVLTGKNCFFNL